MTKIGNYEIKLEKADDKGMLDLELIKQFILKAEKAICKILLPNSYGSGFFCKIPYTENINLLLPVLITCNHVLSKDIIESKNNIDLIFNDGKKMMISLKETRKKWTDEIMDFTIIEIKENDDIEEYFQLDENIFKKNYSNENYLKNKAIIYGINKNQRIGFSNGNIIEIIEECFFAYTCNTYPGCSGGCIVNENNNCVIGIHRGGDKSSKVKDLNFGTFIWNIINYISRII